MVRLFVAIDLPPEMREVLKSSQEELAKSRARLSVVSPENIHITLKFIGEVDEGMVPAIQERLASVTGRPFEVSVSGISADNRRRPRVVWCDVVDGGMCAALNEQIEQALEPLGIRKESRRFRPHATLARVKRFDPSLLDAIRPMESAGYGQFKVDGFSLKKSTLTPAGAIYEDVLVVNW